MVYYLKKCREQELGSVDTEGHTHRGRYLYISKNDDVLGIFPPLSTAHRNDSALIAIIPLFNGKKVYCNFSYHNDKYHNSNAVHPRNEYRIYLNQELENYQKLINEDDIIIIRSESTNDETITGNPGTHTVYYLDLIKNRGSRLYIWLDELIKNHHILGGHGLYDGVIEEFESKVRQLRIESEIPVVIDKSVTNRLIKDPPADPLADLFTAVSFRDFVMVGYGNLCAVTGSVIRYDNYMNLEAAHIRPHSHEGTYLPNNGIALNRDLHWAFDKGFFTLTDDLLIKVHPEVSSEWLQSYNGKQIRIPANNFFIPAHDNIAYHSENIYGLFKTSGRL